MEDNRKKEKEPVKYYGKKLYQINPCFIKKKRVDKKTPDYANNEHQLARLDED
jgi:hypothetical protein